MFCDWYFFVQFRLELPPLSLPGVTKLLPPFPAIHLQPLPLTHRYILHYPSLSRVLLTWNVCSYVSSTHLPWVPHPICLSAYCILVLLGGKKQVLVLVFVVLAQLIFLSLSSSLVVLNWFKLEKHQPGFYQWFKSNFTEDFFPFLFFFFSFFFSVFSIAKKKKNSLVACILTFQIIRYGWNFVEMENPSDFL